MNYFRCETTIVLNIIIIFITILNYGYSASIPNEGDLFIVNITMKNFTTTQEDQYAYIQYKLPDEELFIIGYSPLIRMNSAHHMLTYACDMPASNEPFWSGSGPCIGNSMIIHGWGLNAPKMTLPEDVGIAVGRDTPYKYIVVNIHYLLILKNDNSGNQIIMTRKPRKYHAGVMLGGSSDIYLPPKTQTIRTTFSCSYNGPPISIFACRVHAHQWARVNSLYRVRDGKVTQIIKNDPRLPQSFYPLSSPVDIKNGDHFIGQCVYDNNDDRVVTVGATHHDEMCNVYAMYSFEPEITGDGKQKSDSVPIQSCYGNSVSKLTALIPSDSVIPPIKSPDMNGTHNDHQVHAEHGMESPRSNLYVNIEKWPDLKSSSIRLGEIGGIALNNANDELVVFNRGSRKWEFKYFDGFTFRHNDFGPIDEDVLIHFDTHTGQIKSKWGAKMFYMPHGLTIDHDGNYWITDIAMHQVMMFKPNDLKHPALTVGDLFQPGSGKKQFCRPADIAVMKNGDFFVADGYCNNRIIKFNSKGEYIMEWGSPMTGQHDVDYFPLPNEWNIVHSIALNEDAQLICGADRENFRIQCFNLKTGEFLRQIHVEKKETAGALYAIEFAPNTNETILYAVTGGAQTSKKKVYMINAQNGDVLTSFDSNPSLTAPHDITVSKNAWEIYVGELASSSNNGLHKFELLRNKDLPTQTSNRLINFNNKNFRISLIIIIAVSIPILLAIIVGCIIRMRNTCKLRRLNRFLNDIKDNDTKHRSIFGNWRNRHKGFELLEQHSDGENEPLDSNINDDSNNNSSDEIVTFPTQQQPKNFLNTTLTIDQKI